MRIAFPSRYVAQRAQQRAIPAAVGNLLLDHGDRLAAGGGAEIVRLSGRGRAELADELRLQHGSGPERGQVPARPCWFGTCPAATEAAGPTNAMMTTPTQARSPVCRSPGLRRCWSWRCAWSSASRAGRAGPCRERAARQLRPSAHCSSRIGWASCRGGSESGSIPAKAVE